MRAAWDVAAIARLAALIRSQRVSVVHTHSSIDGWLGGFAARAAGVPVVRTRHVSIPVRRRFNPVYTRLADRVITSGEAIRQILIRAGVPPARAVAIPAGVDLETFPFRARAPEVARGLGATAPVIGSVAMFRGSKGHDHLIEAFAVVRGIHPTATLLLVGDGIRRASVEALVREAGLAHAVIFTGFRAEIPALLGAMDCFVLASTRTEGVPQSLLQAFAAGVPVVASDVGGIPEVVVDGVTGVLVKSESAGALAGGILGVLDQRDAAERRALAARRVVEERFSHAASIARLVALYDEVLGTPGAFATA
jgi:glycosyltransferase involved in cell wall biosynthesis